MTMHLASCRDNECPGCPAPVVTRAADPAGPVPLVKVTVKTENGTGVLTFHGQEWWHGLPDGEHALYLAHPAPASEPDTKAEAWKRAGFAVLPKITDDLLDEYGGGQFMIDKLSGDGPQWTQTAVDFACLVAGHLTPPAAARAEEGEPRLHWATIINVAATLELDGNKLVQAFKDNGVNVDESPL